MKSVIIDKDKWWEMSNWCFETFDLDSWELLEGPTRFAFKHDADQGLFVLKWMTYINWQ